MLPSLRTQLRAQPPARIHAWRRLLATETAIPDEPSVEFLNEERRRRGTAPGDDAPAPTADERKAQYELFLQEKAREAPKRPNLRVAVDPAHGLWAFFRKVQRGSAIMHETLEQSRAGQGPPSGRAWTAAELRRKSFKDLHTLWYVVLRERNLLATQKAEGTRLDIPPRSLDAPSQDAMCRDTMARIKQVLNERRRAYEQAVSLQRETGLQEAGTSSVMAAHPASASASGMKDGFKVAISRQGSEILTTRDRKLRAWRPNDRAVARANAFRLQAAMEEAVSKESAADVSASAAEGADSRPATEIPAVALELQIEVKM